MLYQIAYEINGRTWATPLMSESSKKAYVEGLTAAGIEYTELQRPEEKQQCVRMVFDLQLVEAAKNAIAARKTKGFKGMYTFIDEKKIVDEKGAYWVECTDGRKKIAYAVGIWKATTEELEAFKAEIGCKNLGPVISKI